MPRSVQQHLRLVRLSCWRPQGNNAGVGSRIRPLILRKHRY